MADSLYPELTFNDVDEFNAERLNAAMSTLDARLRAQESLQITYEAAVDQLNRYGLVRLNDAVQPVYDRLASIARIGVIFSVLCDTPNRLGTGKKSFIIPAARRLTFAPAAYLQVLSTGDGGKAMYGSTQSYDDQTGELIVNVDQIRGIDEGVITSWNITAAGTPVVLNSANDLGVYTQQQADEKIAQAINNLRGSTPSDRATLAAINDALNALTDGAVGIRNFAQAATAINNRLQVDKNQGLNATAKSQALSNLGVSDFIKSLLSQPDFDSARSYLGLGVTQTELTSRVAKVGDTMTGHLTMNGTVGSGGAGTRYVMPNNADWLVRGIGGNRMQFCDGAATVEYVSFGADGSITTRQFGDLNTRIESRAAAHAQSAASSCVKSGRFVFAGDLYNSWNLNGGFGSPYGGYACIVDRATVADGTANGAWIPGIFRWRYFQLYTDAAGWVTCAAAS